VQRDFPEATAKNLGLGFVSEHIKSNLQQMVMQVPTPPPPVCELSFGERYTASRL
jgi:hypothetical protein